VKGGRHGCWLFTGVGGGSFGNAALGDKRRTHRLVKVAAAFNSGACCGGGGTITSVIPATHQAKAAYRLLDCESVTHPSVIESHCRHVRSTINEPGVTLLIEDTTAIAYPGLKQSSGLGPIGEAFTRGFWLHSTLAVRWELSSDASEKDRCWPIGLLHQHAWARPTERPARRKRTGRGKEPNHARQKRKDRESIRWAAVLATLPAMKREDSSLIFVADRESDIYEVFGKCRAAGVSFVIRAAYARATVDDEFGADLMSAAENAPVRGHLQLDLPQHHRTATMEVRGIAVELRGPPRPGGRAANVTLGVVRVREVDPPAGVEPLEWTLLTDQPVDTLKACGRVMRIYRCRWMIEELHKEGIAQGNEDGPGFGVKPVERLPQAQRPGGNRIGGCGASIANEVVGTNRRPEAIGGRADSRADGEAIGKDSSAFGKENSAVALDKHRASGRVSRPKKRRPARLADALAWMANPATPPARLSPCRPVKCGER